MKSTTVTIRINHENASFCGKDCPWIRKVTAPSAGDYCALFERGMWREVFQGNQRTQKCRDLVSVVERESKRTN